MPDAENFSHLITQPWMVSVFVSIILLVALRPLYQAVLGIGAVNRDLDAATKILTQLGKNQQDEFYNQFKTIHNQILRIPGLRHAWRQFVDSMYFEAAIPPAVHNKVYLSHRPSHYFNRSSVLGTRLNLPQFMAYPNYLIGIGLTFTFIGLAAALHVAQAGLASGAGQQALKDLLAVASIKFVSSIAGIASSLVISALQRVRLRTFQQKLDAFCDLLEECTKYKSTEKLLHDSLNEQRRQTAMLGDMGGIVAAGISAQLAAGITQGLHPLTQDVKLLAQHFAEGSERALTKMLTEFLHALRQTSIDEMQTLQQSLGALAAHLESTGQGFGADTKAASAQLAAEIEKLNEVVAPMQRGLAQFGQSLEPVAGHLKRTADDNQKVAAELSATFVDIARTLAVLREVLATLPESLQSGGGYFARLKSKWRA